MMGNNERKLLPYEHQLIESLGITKEEYLNFVAQQHIYSDPKEGSFLDIRNDFGIVAIVLTIVGTILQVVGALLLKPEEAKGEEQQTRDTIFAPRSGFNAAQELAKYGDPINLIYTNKNINSDGGVRVATSLLWSAIKSFGSSQYMQLLLLLGGGGIGRIDFRRTAFGQTPIRDLILQNYWVYFKENATGFITTQDLKAGGGGENDPIAINSGSRNLYRINPGDESFNGDGFSHALSPSTSTSFGSYGPVPLNVNIVIRDERGYEESVVNQIKADLNGWGESSPDSINSRIKVGQNLIITLAKTFLEDPSTVEEDAADHRRALSSVFDNAGIFKLGSARFSVLNVSQGSTDEGDVVIKLRCIEGGLSPSISYGTLSAKGSSQALANEDPIYIALKKQTNALLLEDDRDKEIRDASDLLKNGMIYVKATIGYKFKRLLTATERDVLQSYIDYEEAIKEDVIADDRFFNKALVKIETASYETISLCHIVDLSLKVKVFRRISGRQESYGSKQRPGYSISDNGLKLRTALFLMQYKRVDKTDYQYVKGIFAARRAADVDNFIYLRFNSGQFGLENAQHWQFKLEPIHDTMAEIKHKQLAVNGKTSFFYLENSGEQQTIELEGGKTISFVGSIVSDFGMFPPRNESPRDTNEWDLFSNTADTQLQMSFDGGPEFSLAAVTEQIAEPFSNFPRLYQDMSLVGFNIYSGRTVQDLRSLSMFVTQGRYSRLLRTSGVVNGIAWGQVGFEYLPANANGYANTAPDIFIDTVIDRNDGIGKYAGDLFCVDLEQLARSKKFCEINNLFMDGIIAEPTSWRQFWATNAPFSLLELAKRDGKETLIPGVPYDPSTGQITRNIQVTALFNQGNILEDSYKEEFIDYGNSTEDVIVTAIYRDSEREGAFPKNNSVDVQLSGVDEDVAMRETIDLSQFVTKRSQAILLGKFLCQTRRHSRRSIEFKTFPTDSLVTPGGFIYVDLAQNQWNNIESGSIGANGELNLPLAKQVNNGSYQVLMYNPNDPAIGTVFKSNVAVSENRASSLASFVNYIFVLGTAIRSKRVFRITEVAMDEEGEVTIRGVEHPTDENGLSLISEGLNTTGSGLFAIDGRPE